MDLGLDGRRALITGASRGIGRAIVDALAAEGCSLALCARGEDQLFKTRDELEQKGAKVFADTVDVGDPDAIRQFVSDSAQALGGLDVVVSNASPVRPLLADSDQAAVVAISSTSALDVDLPSGPVSFGAIKAAVLHHASALARAYAADGIRVNTVSPGPIEFAGGSWDQVRQSRPQVYEVVKAKLPLGRYGAPEDVANAVAFLVSGKAAFCTGVNLVVDGGLLSRVPH